MRETFSRWLCKQVWKLKKTCMTSTKFELLLADTKRQYSLLCGILLLKSSTWAENLIDKTELHIWLSHQACRWWYEDETLQPVLQLLCFRLTCHTQLVNCPSVSSWRPTHAHVCAQEGLLGWHFIKESTEEVPAQNATVNSEYLNTGNIQYHVRNSYTEHETI